MIRLALITTLLTASISLSAAEYPATDRWEYTMIGFRIEDEVNPKPKDAIVATGSSSMRFWDHRIHDDLKPLTIISRGFGGSNMNDVLTYLDDLVIKHEPRAVMIYEGDNDVWQGVPVADIVNAYTTSISKIHDHDADIRIYLLSVKPSISRAALWETMQEVNASMKQMADRDPRIHYIDVATPMLNPDGSVIESLFVPDGLHMNQAGYDIWRDTVAPYLLEHEARYEFTR